MRSSKARVFIIQDKRSLVVPCTNMNRSLSMSDWRREKHPHVACASVALVLLYILSLRLFVSSHILDIDIDS